MYVLPGDFQEEVVNSDIILRVAHYFSFVMVSSLALFSLDVHSNLETYFSVPVCLHSPASCDDSTLRIYSGIFMSCREEAFLNATKGLVVVD